MKSFLMLAVSMSLFSIGLAGCSEKSTSKTETKVTTPGGETTTTIEREVKKSGDNPPPARP